MQVGNFCSNFSLLTAFLKFLKVVKLELQLQDLNENHQKQYSIFLSPDLRNMVCLDGYDLDLLGRAFYRLPVWPAQLFDLAKHKKRKQKTD